MNMELAEVSEMSIQQPEISNQIEEDSYILTIQRNEPLNLRGLTKNYFI
ncbi:14757_t:CDS:2 [Entrophospora sp. SA101]|nr:14757_t:CDS:2 [Entrophospora sp. SA101]